MDREEFFSYHGKIYPKGTVVWRMIGSKKVKSIFLWRYTKNSNYLVINIEGFTTPGHLPRSLLSTTQFFDSILSIENPSSDDFLMVKEFEKDFFRKESISKDGPCTFVAIIALVVGTMLFPPLGLILGFYAFTRKK